MSATLERTTDTACPHNGSECNVRAARLPCPVSVCERCPQGAEPAPDGASDAAGHARRAREWAETLEEPVPELPVVTQAEPADDFRAELCSLHQAHGGLLCGFNRIALALNRIDYLAKVATGSPEPMERMLARQILTITEPALRPKESDDESERHSLL